MPSDPFSSACLAARQRVPLDPPVESTEMPETPQIGTEIGITYGEFKGMENKEDPNSDPGICRWEHGPMEWVGNMDDFLQWLEAK